MFFRKITTRKNGRDYVYVKLIENFRVDGKIKQRVVANFGSVDNLSPDRINYLINGLKKLHNEMEAKSTETISISAITAQVAKVRTQLNSYKIKEAIRTVLGSTQLYELAEAIICKSLAAPAVDSPIHEVCKQIGLVDASSLQFYNVVKSLGQEEAKGIITKARLLDTQRREKDYSPIFIHINKSVFEGTSFEVDLTGNNFFPQDYRRNIFLLLACDADGFPLDFEYVEGKGQIPGQIEKLCDRLKILQTTEVVILDRENYLAGRNTKYPVAVLVRDVPQEITGLLKQGSVVLGDKVYFNTVQTEQKSESKIKEIKANLAKVSAGMENIRADILLGKISRESAVRKRAESIIKANGCQEMVTYSFVENSQKFTYKINDEILKSKTQSLITTCWVINKPNIQDEYWRDVKTVNITTDNFSVIVDQLKIPPINMYADYHYSEEIISGHIQLEIIKNQISMVIQKPGQGGEM